MIKKAGAVGPKGGWFANIIMTIDRKGAKFDRFCVRLFESMFKGHSMLLTWVQLAPQIPGREHPDAPSTILAAEAGHLAFERTVAP